MSRSCSYTNFWKPAQEMDTLSSPNSNALSELNAQLDASNPIPSRKRTFAAGIVLLVFVVFLWTSSNFLTQDLYEGGYDKPFFVTYMNTSSFSLYLIPFLLRRWWNVQNKIGTKIFVSDGAPHQYEALTNEDIDVHVYEDPSHHLSFSGDNLAEQPAPPPAPLNDRQTANLAFAFCLIWFIANWSVNASLGYTSVASATVLSSMSGFFTLAIGRLFRVERLTLIKLGAVCMSFLGVVIVSLSDSGMKQAAGPASHPTIQPPSVNSRAALGDMLALISAMFYAMYVILLKVRIKSESRIDMQLFFGFVGLFNIIACWPIGVALHFTGVELFELPSSRKALSAILINMAITLSSDYLYVLAMLKTTPLVVTIGLSLTIPVAVLGDFIRHRPAQIAVVGGAVLVLASFVAVGYEDSNEQDSQPYHGRDGSQP
ncbi:hypothetical protein BDN70DRAFT_879845 [Pholiota conissans]|uniref:EamA domain-containing protein n=1 Tax=Pholiota conissans TaxID=109636 RepID=A0A9P5Z0E6_9AGAR|nr:hypothetical protein BDN70DRAFT_879845 [Pholiota conissans]